MFLNKPEEKDLKDITLDEFEIGLMNLIRKDVQPDRLNPEDKFNYKHSPAYQLQEKVMKEYICDSQNCDNK